MPAKNPDLHGNAPDKCPVALLIIDMINDLEFPEGDQIEAQAIQVAERIAELKRRCVKNKIPVIYVNDNFGRWRSDFSAQVDHVLHDGVRGQPLAELLTPCEDDYFVLKPKHSGFYSTSLELLLDYLQARTLILTGIAGNICVLFTANDAYQRDFHLLVPADCIASNTAAENQAALDQMQQVLRADIGDSPNIKLPPLPA
ncbi:cysteine hydrolase family protein [Anatilimnocola sp. NA78]|uniref:cysteine hydrolase family protein n=1 Tax=Anatilimnocola sp. NA78 TaxID=3415683 RepID=UPI003CE49B90